MPSECLRNVPSGREGDKSRDVNGRKDKLFGTLSELPPNDLSV